MDVCLDKPVGLGAPAPNPATGLTTLTIGVRELTEATVVLYNVLG